MEECVIKYKDNFYLKTEVGCKKIILTTDKDLIDDNVQALTNTFLEWFVKNPNCEYVKLDFVSRCISCGSSVKSSCDYAYKCNPQIFYKIITMKEESKQYPIGGCAPGFYSYTCVTCKKQFQGDKRAVQCEPCAIEMTKEETIEEAALRRYQYTSVNPPYTIITPKDKVQGFIAGAKWQQKQMYSEEEVLSILYNWSMYKIEIELDKLADELPNILSYKEWFEQFKKK